MKAPKPFATETALCARFIAALPPEWTAYPETAGWDILLVRGDGLQIGVSAKLRLNAAVISQAIEDGGSWSVCRPGPDFRAILVPHGDTSGWISICDHLGITIIQVRAEDHAYRRTCYDPSLPEIKEGYPSSRDTWHDRCPAERHRLPEYVPDVAAGAPAPLQLTTWKIGAIKIAVILEIRGFVTRPDFKAIGIDHRRWIGPGFGWLRAAGDRYVRGDRFPNFEQQHPRNYAEIRADIRKWMPTLLGEPATIAAR